MISLDFIERTFPKGNLTIIDGRPNTGKTALGILLAFNLAKLAKSSIFFSLEMSKASFIQKMIMIVGKEQYNELKEAIVIDNTPRIDLNQIRNHPHLHIADYVFVDYLQLMDTEIATPANKRTYLAGNLQLIAKEYNIGIIAFSHLPRSGNTQESFFPKDVRYFLRKAKYDWEKELDQFS